MVVCRLLVDKGQSIFRLLCVRRLRQLLQHTLQYWLRLNNPQTQVSVHFQLQLWCEVRYYKFYQNTIIDEAYSLSYPLYNMWGCVFSVYPFPLWWLREYIYFVLLSSSNRKYELLPLFRVRSWNNGVRCMSFYILMMSFIYIYRLLWRDSYIPTMCNFGKFITLRPRQNGGNFANIFFYQFTCKSFYIFPMGSKDQKAEMV